MMRRCNGSDPFLSMFIDSESHQPLTGSDMRGMVAGDYVTIPCACGRMFDDVLRMTVWPHEHV